MRPNQRDQDFENDEGHAAHESEEEENDEEDGDEECPEGTIACPVCGSDCMRETSWQQACTKCGGRGWLHRREIDAELGSRRVPCLECWGEGSFEGGGPPQGGHVPGASAPV
jgi:hypothetical protein